MKEKLKLRYLRKTLKYRPAILELILKLRVVNKKKLLLIEKLKQRLQVLKNEREQNINTTVAATKRDNYTQCDILSHELSKDISEAQVEGQLCKVNTKVSSTQTEDSEATKTTCEYEDTNKIDTLKNSDSSKGKKETAGWNINETKGKSIAEQVKEAAQNALQQSGMVYVESAGMYYDYKTGYYYHSDLGLYYHTDTGCYYYYSDEKQEFVFHSYPDRNAVARNASLEAHERRKARKHKKGQQKEDIENLTKNMAKDKEDDATKPKRKKTCEKVLTEGKSDSKSETLNTDSEKSDVKKAQPETENKDNENEKEMDSSTKKVDPCKEALEDGECSETESENEEEDGDDVESNASTATDESVSKHQPPCMRVIVRETNLPKLKVGSLFVVTKDGGTVGREGDHHAILLRDSNVSRNHLNITYDMERRMYVATDLGSKNGTLLNGVQMSESQVVSKQMEIVHGSTIQLGETKLLCHIHPGNDTCGHCEPGLIMENLEKEKVAYTRTCSVKKQHELELARLKNKYGPPPRPAIEDGSYNDRAQQRREKVGSSHHAEKTLTADVDTFLAPENKGFKMLEKMGWSKGEGLGRDNQGETEPVPLVSNEGKAGMGAGGCGPAGAGLVPRPRAFLGPNTMRLAAKSKLLQPPAKAFQQNDDDDEE